MDWPQPIIPDWAQPGFFSRPWAMPADPARLQKRYLKNLTHSSTGSRSVLSVFSGLEVSS